MRDMVRGRMEPADLDYVVLGGTEDDLRRNVPGLIRVGRDIPVFLKGATQYTFSTFTSIEDDLASRDLTINALAQDKSGVVIAHPLALADLRDKILRPVSADNFLADPLRVIRAARFAAVLSDFSVHAELLAAMRSVSAQGLGSVAAERVGQESLKACEGHKPGNFLRILHAGDALDPWLAEFAAADAIPAGPSSHHDTSVLEHTAQVMDGCAGQPMAVWMALCHDLGKTVTPVTALPRHIGHEKEGEPLAANLAFRLRLPKRHLVAGRLAVRWHMAGGLYANLRPSTKVRLLLALDRAGVVDQFFQMVAADQGGNHTAAARKDLLLIKSVRLPDKHRGLGPRSAEILLQLRCEALADLSGQDLVR
ncbi:MAG: tRNA nucleotidyltransferase [Desulfovibrionales bacterium]|nr:tRNA nucleotidyltransferase [Desulfovibrionales bacterium]